MTGPRCYVLDTDPETGLERKTTYRVSTNAEVLLRMRRHFKTYEEAVDHVQVRAESARQAAERRKLPVLYGKLYWEIALVMEYRMASDDL